MNLYSHSTGSRRVVAFLAAAAALTFAQTASAGITPGDTFTFDIVGFNDYGASYILGSSLSATFGSTQTFSDVGQNGQDYIITSSEVVGATTTTDTFEITTPTNFLKSTAIEEEKITGLQFDLGDANSGASFGTDGDPLNLTGVVSSTTSTGIVLYSGGSFALIPAVTLSSDGMSYSAAEGVDAGTTAISDLAVNEFDLSVTYDNPVSAVPETGNWALLLAGLAGMSVFSRRARKS